MSIEEQLSDLRTRRSALQARADETVKRMFRWGATAAGFLLFVILASCSAQVVETGHRGVKVTLGKPGSASLPEGLYFIVPMVQRMVELNVQQLKWESQTAAYTQDVQQADIKFTLTYNLDPVATHIVYREVGKDWAARLIGQVAFEELKNEIGQHRAESLVASRAQAARAIEIKIRAALAARHITLGGFQLTNIDYTPEFETAVEAKVIAQQKAIEEQNRTAQIKEQAKQKVEQATGAAAATVLAANAEAESITIRARALAQNPNLIEWEKTQVLRERWNGAFPTTVLGDAVPLMNLGK